MSQSIRYLSANETIPDGTPGIKFEGGGRINWISFVSNDGATDVLLSFDAPHPIPDPITIPAGEMIRDIPVAGGFDALWVACIGGTSDVRILGIYRPDLPDREKEIRTREGILELLREIRNDLRNH